MMLKTGSLINGTYKVLNKIGQGGMSVVYLAMNERANKQWAIKEVQKDGVENYEMVKQRLITETDMLKKLRHPNLPSIVDVIEDKDRFLIVMDYIEGISLKRAMEESPAGAMEQGQVIGWARQLCGVLGYLHTRKPPIIYRDMKPSNVMLKPDGNVMLIDFGTAREFKENKAADTAVLGTVGYAAPEQYGGQGQTDARTDIYCLGATLYHLLTGQNPCAYQYGIYPFQKYPIRCWNPALSSGLEAIILKCTKSLPAERYQSCAELMYALEHYKELDKAYIRKQNRKLGIFLAAFAGCVLAAAAAAGSQALAGSLTSHNYDTYISEARSDSICPTDEEKVERLKSAIALSPSRPEAYFDLLNGDFTRDEFPGVFLADGNLTGEEAKIMREALNAVGPGRTAANREFFKRNREAYEEFAFQLGISYYYYYEEEGNKNMAREWLQIAAEASALPGTEKSRAQKLSKICGYYSRIGVESKSGDASITYGDYWKDLTEAAIGNLVQETGNKMTALAIYQELAAQIYTNTVKYKNSGITREQMEEELDKIASRLQSDIVIDDVNNQQTALQIKNKVAKLIDQARVQVDIAYGRETVQND